MGARLFVLFLFISLQDFGAQTAPTAGQKFEVASVKRCQNGQYPKGGYVDPARLHLTCCNHREPHSLNLFNISDRSTEFPRLSWLFRYRYREGHRGSIPIGTVSRP